MSIKLIGAAVVAAMIGASPALAQVSSPSSSGMAGDGQSMSNSMASSDTSAMSGMSKSQMAAMKRCQAMPSDKMMKNKRCASMAKMHPDMMQGGAMNGG